LSEACKNDDKMESHSWVLKMVFHTSQYKRNMFSHKYPLNHSPDANCNDEGLIDRSFNFTYFLWPKSNKKTCRKKAIFATQNHG